MAKSNANRKADNLPSTVTVTAEQSAATCTAMIERSFKAVSTLNQSAERTAEILRETCYHTFCHAMQFGDIRLADRLVKELPKGVLSSIWRNEMVAWFRKNSPIRWDAEGKCHLLKEDEPGYTPFDAETAEAKAFDETDEAVRGREKMAAAHKRAMNPVTWDDFKGRVYGLRSFLKAAQEPNKNGDVRGVKKADLPKMQDACTVIEAAFDAFSAGKLKAGEAKEKLSETETETPEALKAAGTKTRKRSAPVQEGEEKAA